MIPTLEQPGRKPKVHHFPLRRHRLARQADAADERPANQRRRSPQEALIGITDVICLDDTPQRAAQPACASRRPAGRHGPSGFRSTRPLRPFATCVTSSTALTDPGMHSDAEALTPVGHRMKPLSRNGSECDLTSSDRLGVSTVDSTDSHPVVTTLRQHPARGPRVRG